MPNPYTPRSSRLFYGRGSVLRALLRDEQSGQSQVVLGGRRCGKTRLLEQLAAYLRARANASVDRAKLWRETVPDDLTLPEDSGQPVHWPVLASMQGHDFQSVADVLTWLGRAIADTKPPIANELLQVPARGWQDAADFEVWMKQVDGALAGAKLGGLALLIDEIEEVLGCPWCPSWLSTLRRWDDATFRTRLWFVLVGSERLDRYRHPLDGSPALNVARRVRLPDLGYESRRRMIVEPFVAAGRLPPPDLVQAEIDHAAGGSVWLLTLLLEYVFEKASYTPEGLSAAREEVLEGQSEVFGRWADAFGAPEWELYALVASRGNVESRDIKSLQQRNARLTLEYLGLVHRPTSEIVELGPELFRDWAESASNLRRPFRDRQPPTAPGLPPPGRYRYDVALSYAGPDAPLAEAIARHLHGLNVFYDRALTEDLWGADLMRCLPSVFDREAQLIVLLVSREYEERIWPRLEARAALLKAVREGWDAVVVASIDGGSLSDYPQHIRCLPVNRETAAAEIALEIRKRTQSKDR